MNHLRKPIIRYKNSNIIPINTVIPRQLLEEIDISLDCEILLQQDICVIEDNKIVRKARISDTLNEDIETGFFHALNTSSMTATVQRCSKGAM